jgi:hypothetical protein
MNKKSLARAPVCFCLILTLAVLCVVVTAPVVSYADGTLSDMPIEGQLSDSTGSVPCYEEPSGATTQGSEESGDSKEGSSLWDSLTAAIQLTL